MWIELSQISPAARMNACSACGGNVPEVPALTTHVFVEHEGDIEICQRCIVEAGRLYGLIDASLLTEKQAEIDELRAWADEAYAEMTARQGTIETISAALARTAAERDALREQVGA